MWKRNCSTTPAQLLLLLLYFYLINIPAVAVDVRWPEWRRGQRPDFDEPDICHPVPMFTNGGQLVMTNYHGHVTLIALMELQCTLCRTQISSIVKLSELFRENYDEPTKFLVVAPHNESDRFVEYYKQYLKPYDIGVIQETTAEPIWHTLRGSRFDFFVYDRCGRLNYYIPYPQSFMYYHYTISSLHSTHRYIKCGPCPSNRQDISTAAVSVGKTLTDDGQWNSNDQRSTFPSETSSVYKHHLPKYQPKNVKAWLQYIRGLSGDPTGENQLDGVDSFAAEVLRERYVKPKHGGRRKNRTRIKQGSKKLTTALPKHSQATTSNDSSIPTTTNANTTVAHTPIPNITENFESTAQIPTTPLMTTSMTTTATTQLIINAIPENSTVGNETDVQDFNNNDNNQTDLPTDDTKKPKYYWSLTPPEEMNCSAYRDSVCLKLQAKNRSHPCCNKGIYVTGLCSPDHCTPDTNQLCCFQRYQQARYACCHDESVPSSRPDDFNRCCYDYFMHSEPEDPCCPSSVAHAYWTKQHRIADLCLPNLQVDYSDVVFQVHLKNGRSELHQLRSVNVLNYTCPYASKRQTFYVFDPSLEPDYHNPEDD
ncbi:Selenoprotein Pb [Trichinella spiralis]|uniref:Selenoprotein Pb n=1 Tax=Trichinella spiralis TaxID=6334 RepID=A0A0V1B2P6_TRISP|nr:Selenoprotein Pb [Trichinella spiralis]